MSDKATGGSGENGLSATKLTVQNDFVQSKFETTKDLPVATGSTDEKQVSASEVADAKRTSTAAAQSTVDQHFPAPTLEEGTRSDPIKQDTNMSVFEPHSTFPFTDSLNTDSFKKLAPSERFRDSGWSPDLAHDLADLTVNHIKETKGKGEFGTDSSHWQDIRTAMQIAVQAHQLDAFVRQVNTLLRNDPATSGLKVEIGHVPSKDPLFGSNKDASLTVELKGATSGDWQSQLQGSREHIATTKQLADRELRDEFLKSGWTPELASQVARTVSDKMPATGSNQFVLPTMDYYDSRSALGPDAGPLSQTLRAINDQHAMKYGTLLERLSTSFKEPSFDVRMKSGKTPAPFTDK